MYEDATVPEPWNVRIETNKPVSASLAVRVERTGRVPNRDGYYRGKITFVGDGEPDVVTRGWTEDGKTLVPRRAGLPQVAWMPYETVQKTGVTARVYGPAPGEDIGKE